MKYILYINYEKIFTNEGESGMPCPFCEGEIRPGSSHPCVNKMSIEVEVPGKVESVRYEKAGI